MPKDECPLGLRRRREPSQACALRRRGRAIPVWSVESLGPCPLPFQRGLRSLDLALLDGPETDRPLAFGLAIIQGGSASMARLFEQVEHLLERVLETPGRL